MNPREKKPLQALPSSTLNGRLPSRSGDAPTTSNASSSAMSHSRKGSKDVGLGALNLTKSLTEGNTNNEDFKLGKARSAEQGFTHSQPRSHESEPASVSHDSFQGEASHQNHRKGLNVQTQESQPKSISTKSKPEYLDYDGQPLWAPPSPPTPTREQRRANKAERYMSLYGQPMRPRPDDPIWKVQIDETTMEEYVDEGLDGYDFHSAKWFEDSDYYSDLDGDLDGETDLDL